MTLFTINAVDKNTPLLATNITASAIKLCHTQFIPLIRSNKNNLMINIIKYRHGCYVLMISIFFIILSGRTFANKEVVLATTERIPYIGESLPNKGYIHELVETVFKHAGYQVRIEFYPPARSRYLLKTGRIDGLLPTYDDPSLTDVVYSMPFSSDKIGLLKKKSLVLPTSLNSSDNLASSLEKLHNYHLGIVREASLPKAFEQARFLSKQEVSKDLHNLDKLYSGRVDVIAIDQYTAAHLMVKYRPHLIGELAFIPATISENAFHLVFSKKAQNHLQMQADFNQSFKTLKASGELNKILNKHGFFLKKTTIANKTQLTIATVNNAEMLTLKAMSTEFEQQHPNIALTWRVLAEGTLRHRLMADLAIANGEFDVLTIGSYETPIWAKNDWLQALTKLPKNYDDNDIFESVKTSLSYQKQLYALPFYTESSMTYYRQDLFKQAKISMPQNPSYDDIARFAAILHNPKEQVYGICLRGKAGWGENMTFFSTMVNAYGGQWFDQQWQPQLDSIAWQKALIMYKNLLTEYGPPRPEYNGYNETKALFAKGHCAIWIDSTVAAGTLFDPKKSPLSAQISLAPAPQAVTSMGSNWLWTWALAIPTSSQHKEAAKTFIAWATSKEYIEKVADREGWLAAPPGTRKSTYQNKAYQQAAPFSPLVLSSIEKANLAMASRTKSNYQGIQFVEIPEFAALGHQVGLYITMAITGKLTVNEALLQAQQVIDEQMQVSQYY